MTIIATEIQKWKRNKIVWCILALTLLFGAFAIERACSIARSSPTMDSFGDLYTLAFKNLSSMTAIVMRDIPGVVITQPLNIPGAFLCIGVWSVASVLLMVAALKKRK